MRLRRNPRRHHVFAAPAWIGAASLAALVVGLLGDGWQDWAAWIGLGTAVAVILWSLTLGPRQ